MIDRLRKYLYRRALGRYKATNLHEIEQNHFRNIRSVGIVFNVSEMNDQKPLRQFQSDLINRNKQVELLGFFDVKEQPEAQDFGYFTLQHLNFAGIPRSDITDQFIARRFDVLINMDYTAHPALSYVCAASKALFKIGPATGKTEHYDLIIDMAGRFDLAAYIKQIRQTFNLIN